METELFKTWVEKNKCTKEMWEAVLRKKEENQRKLREQVVREK